MKPRPAALSALAIALGVLAACRIGPQPPVPGDALATPSAAARLSPADTVTWGRTAADRRAREAGEAEPAYEKTHARTVDGRLAPYVAEYASLNGIDTSALLAALQGVYAPPDVEAMPVGLSSLSHLSGKWTFYRSASVRVHQLLRLRAEGPAPRADTLLAALYSASAPADLLLGDTAAWSLSLLQGPGAYGPGLRVVSTERFRLPRPEAGDDMILLNSALERSGNTLQATVERVSEGGSEDRVQALTAAWVVTGPPWRLVEAGHPQPRNHPTSPGAKP